MSYEEVPLAPHLFKYHCPAKWTDPPMFIIKNSSKKKVRNRARLRSRYAQHLLTLAREFDQGTDPVMFIYYPPRYAYKFEQVDEAYVQVWKGRFGRRPWFQWARYPRGMLHHARDDRAGRQAYLASIRASNCVDLFDLAETLAGRRYCCFCGQQITCLNDLVQLDVYELGVIWERKSLPPLEVTIATACVRCQAKVQAGELIVPPHPENKK